MFKISSALDIIPTRPGDPYYSEGKGMAAMMHERLTNVILTKPATKLYSAQFQGHAESCNPLLFFRSKTCHLLSHLHGLMVIPSILDSIVVEITPFILVNVAKSASKICCTSLSHVILLLAGFGDQNLSSEWRLKYTVIVSIFT